MNFKSEILVRFNFFFFGRGGYQILQQTADKRLTLNVCIFNQNQNGKVETKSYQAIKSEIS